MTRSVCQLAATTLELLTGDLQPGERFELRDGAGVHMTLHVERLADVSDGFCFIVAHRHPGREPVPDPEVALLRATDGRWTPFSTALPLSRLVTARTNGSVLAGRRDEHQRLLKVVNVWMHNVRVHLLKRGVAENQEMAAPVACAAQ